MPFTIGLLGRPSLLDGGEERTIPGHKPWGLLAHLLLAPVPPTRRELGALLWPEANDPMAALRWSLLQVRRAIRPQAAVVERAGRLRVELGEVSVDVHRLLAGDVAPDDLLAFARGELLDGLYFDDAPAFEMWLTLERGRLSSALREALRWSATLLARPDPERALRLIERAVALDPTDEQVHELAVDIHVSRGDRVMAERYFESVVRTYRTELGSDPPATIRRPLDRPRDGATPTGVSPSVKARALLDVAAGRLAAGDYPAAEDSARRAAAEAAAAGDRTLEARALLTLGSTLVHSVRGRDREAVGLLRRAFQLATEIGDAKVAAEAACETGYVAFLAADYGAAEAALRRAVALAEAAGDLVQRGQALTYLGSCLIDRGDLVAAQSVLGQARDGLDSVGERRFRNFTLSVLARALIRDGRLDEGKRMAQEALAGARAVGWQAVVPWILVHLGEVELAQGDVEAAAGTFGEAFTLGAEMADPCWESLALRGLAHVESRRGASDRARDLLADAHQRCTRVPDTLWWADAAILTDLVELEGGRDRGHLDAALRLARQGPMPDLAARLFRYERQTEPPTGPQTGSQTAR